MDRPEHIEGTMQKIEETMSRNLVEFAEGIQKLSLILHEFAEGTGSWMMNLRWAEWLDIKHRRCLSK